MSTTQIKDSILHDIKQMVGVEFDDDSFDLDIKIHINSVFFTLNQIGVGPEAGYEIAGESDLWSAYLGGKLNLNSVKTYVYTKVRLLFDPPTNSFLVDALKKQAEELEWRLQVDQDKPLGLDQNV